MYMHLIDLSTKYKYENLHDKLTIVCCSVADPDPFFVGHPDPDPGKYGIRILYPPKDPCNSNFLVIKLF